MSQTNKWLENYIYEHHGKTILTDYDEDLHYLNAVFPLNDVTNGSILSNKIIRFSQQIYDDFKRR